MHRLQIKEGIESEWTQCHGCERGGLRLKNVFVNLFRGFVAGSA